MKLIRDGSMFSEIHRHGWPYVMRALHRVANGRGILLDDFVEASFSYSRVQPHQEAWVGIFHHPASVHGSPNKHDKKSEVINVLNNRDFIYCRDKLRGAVCMAPDLAALLRDMLDVPVLLVHHPTDLDVPQWRQSEARIMRQVGWYLRNVRLVHSFKAREWFLCRQGPTLGWHFQRDRAFKKLMPRVHENVADVQRLDNSEYDAAMTTNAVCMEVYGAAANNVLIECIARGTPLLVNRTPAAEWYLGNDYPLFFETGSLLGKELPFAYEDFVAAHHYQVDRIERRALHIERFTKAVVDFCGSL